MVEDGMLSKITMKLDGSMAAFVKEYIATHPELCYKSVSAFVEDSVQERIKVIKEREK